MEQMGTESDRAEELALPEDLVSALEGASAG
jgi:hypothetical protein